MNDHNDSAMGGALTGIVLSAATAWARYDDDTQRRLRNNREDVRELGTEVRDLQSRGEAIRSRLPVVQDVQVGFAVANAAATSKHWSKRRSAPAAWHQASRYQVLR